jgi:hypothetical protein
MSMKPHHRPPDHLEMRYTSYTRIIHAIACKCSLLSPQLSLSHIEQLLAYVSFLTHNKLSNHAMFFLFQHLPGSNFVNTLFASGGSHNSNNPPNA